MILGHMSAILDQRRLLRKLTLVIVLEFGVVRRRRIKWVSHRRELEIATFFFTRLGKKLSNVRVFPQYRFTAVVLHELFGYRMRSGVRNLYEYESMLMADDHLAFSSVLEQSIGRSVGKKVSSPICDSAP